MCRIYLPRLLFKGGINSSRASDCVANFWGQLLFECGVYLKKYSITFLRGQGWGRNHQTLLLRFSVGPSVNPAVTVPSWDRSGAFSPHQQLLFIDGDELVERPAQVMDSVQKFLKIPQVNYLKLLRLVQSVLNVTFVSVAARCATDRGLWGLVVVWMLWLSGRALAAQARGVLGSTPCDATLFNLPLFSPRFIYWHVCLSLETNLWMDMCT